MLWYIGHRLFVEREPQAADLAHPKIWMAHRTPSGAGTNLKAGGTGPERKWGDFFGRVPPHFFCL